MLRLSMVAVLYLFLVALVATLRRGLVQHPEVASEVESAGQLIVLEPGTTGFRPGQALSLQATTSLGRNEGNTLVLADGFVSGRHAVLALRAGVWWLRDLNSTNGTYVNQQPIEGEVALESGDVIGIGSARLKFSP